MIKADIKDPKVVIEATGSPGELVDDVCLLLSGLYRQISRSSPNAAKAWKALLQLIINDEDGPLYDTAPRPGEQAVSIIVPKNKKKEMSECLSILT